ncbi:hypothetical protein MK805_16160 [Shimazuella sp. AN120528]|uniref:hypothetical protein n=1 Tax=Shimazuella soli TaxID=1892854 RepID=UPI001F10E9BE|nr:hypothetical protein [Shimazuella soli]MCH5586475.1 hypothetical protein [Shimazuella soli]
MKRKKGADVNQEHEYGISSFLSAPSSFQENEICQKISFRLVHTIKQRRQFAISILEIYVTEPMFTDLIQDVYPDSDLFLLKMNADIFMTWNKSAIVQIISHHRDGIPDKFDIIIISPNCQFQREMPALFQFSGALLEESGIVATTFFGPHTFMELHNCLSWIDDSEMGNYPPAQFNPRTYWEKRLEQDGLHLEDVQEVQFRKTYHNSQGVFQMAALFGYFHAMEQKLADDNNHLLHNWMKAYDQGFRTKDGNVYTTYHLIDLIGRFL